MWENWGNDKLCDSRHVRVTHLSRFSWDFPHFKAGGPTSWTPPQSWVSQGGWGPAPKASGWVQSQLPALKDRKAYVRQPLLSQGEGKTWVSLQNPDVTPYALRKTLSCCQAQRKASGCPLPQPVCSTFPRPGDSQATAQKAASAREVCFGLLLLSCYSLGLLI